MGSEANRNLLVHFLNAILVDDLTSPIADVEILNPYNDKEFLDDKLSVVDVKARDGEGRLYQIEIQMLNYRKLPARIVYAWCDIVSQQLQSGQDYNLPKPVYSIWPMAENLLPGEAGYAHEYRLSDRRGRTLGNPGAIHVLELKKFTAERIEIEEQRWLKFFKDGEKLDETALPDWMNTQEMRQAMSTLKLFSEKERDYFAYQARQDFLREQRALQLEREEALRELEQARNETERARQEKELARQETELAQRQKERAYLDLERERAEKQAAQAEIERLKTLLAQTKPD